MNQKILQKLTLKDVEEQGLLDEEAMILVAYLDEEHEDHMLFYEAFEEVANELSEFEYIETQWFIVDALADPEIEDTRE